MEVRAAAATDVEAIAEVHVGSWREAYVGQVPQSYLESVSVEQRVNAWTHIHAQTDWPSSGILVLVDEGAVVRFAHVCPSRDDDADDATGELTAIYLRRAVWRRGGGRALMSAVIAALVEAGFAAGTLWVLDSNEPARRFYEAAGWRPDNVEKLDTIGGQQIRELRYRLRLS